MEDTISRRPQKHVIALACSPSKGRNSDSMLDAFIDGMRKEGILVDKYYINDMRIDLYTYQNGKAPAPEEHEFAALARSLSVADGLVIATPTYNFSVPAQLKNFIDRIRFVALDTKERNRFGQPRGLLGNVRTYFLVSGGISKWSEKVLFFAFPSFWLRGVFLYYGARVLGAYYSDDIRTFENTHILGLCTKKGQVYARQVQKGRGNRIFERIFFRPAQKE